MSNLSKCRSVNYHSVYFFFILLIILAGCENKGKNLPEKTVLLNNPYAEWSLEFSDYSGNPFDVIASATFTHEESGTVKRSLMFFDSYDSLWKFRFTGTRTGLWKIDTEGPGKLGGLTGVVQVTSSGDTLPGFLAARGNAWIWEGSRKEIIPQLVMMGGWRNFWKEEKTDTAAIDKMIREFIVETGFTGFHFPGGGGEWFNIESHDTYDEQGEPLGEQNPDMRTFMVMEEFLTRSYKQKAATHIWMWGSEKWAKSGPDGIGGAMSVTDQRVLRYIAARLGPIPGWSMGYGYDLHVWADAGELQTWYDFFKEQLGDWKHLLGARADKWDANNRQLLDSEQKGLPRSPLSEVYWQGDYVGHYDYRVSYPWYREVMSNSSKPQFQEDRFRIREHEIFENKDYTPEMTVRGLWHSTMAGGVANIWGSLLPGNDNLHGSQSYNSRAGGSIQGTSFTVELKDAIKTYNHFWFEKDRFSYSLVPDNQLTGNKTGDPFLEPAGGGFLSVCLRSADFDYFVFYTENSRSVRMDLEKMTGKATAVAVDTRKPYDELFIGGLNPKDTIWNAPYQSDWAIAVGQRSIH